MKAVQHIIRILVILLIDHACCQDGYSDRDILRYQQMAANEGQIESITSYSTNIIQRDPNSQSISSVNVQYHMTDDAQNNNRADRTRSKKVYRIKNPFQNQLEEINPQAVGNADPQDSGTAASNQYASMQYSLPPEEFLQQMRSGNQFHQTQPQQQTTPAPSLGYTATPQPQYQYSTITSSGYDNTNQQTNQITQLEPKSQTQYLNNNGYQFNPQNTFHFDSVQSTPSPITTYLPTALPNSQYVGTPSNYVSSSSPIFLSSPTNLQYVSSPLTAIQNGSPDYGGNRITTTIGSNSLSYDNNEQNKKLQIDHYDNSGIRYPVNPQQQLRNEYSSSTLSPATVSYDTRDSWPNNLNPGVNALSKSLQEVSLTQYQNYPYNQQDSRSDSNLDANADTHRIGSMASANNVFLNYAQPDYQSFSNVKGRIRDTDQESSQPDYYSNGEYGWKLADKRPQLSNDVYSSGNVGNYQRYQNSLQNNNSPAVSQMTFHMDTSRPSSTYEQVSKSATEMEAQDFAKAAANAHEYMKQQQNYYGNNYGSSYNSNQGTSYNPNPFYSSSIDKIRNKYTESSTPSPYIYSSQPDLITASPYYYNSRENSIDSKPKQPFDHAKALKTIVPIDVSNVVSNAESQLKGIDNDRYTLQNYGKEQINQNQQQFQQQYRPISDSYYKDKNAYYGINIKSKPDDYQSDNIKQFDTNMPYYAKPQHTSEPVYNQGFSGGPQRIGYNNQPNYQDNIQTQSNIQQGLRPQNQVPTDINTLLKLNDVPYQITQTLSPESFRFQNSDFDHGNLPTQLPVRINQDVASHQLDVTSNILSKLLLNKQPSMSFNRPDIDSPNGLSTINGFKVANPFNVDLKLVAEMLKGKSPENTNIMSLREQFNKPAPLKLDLSQLQLLLKNENIGNLAPINEGLSALSNPFLEVYNSGRFPYQGMKYSRSQEEEEETIVPIADASNSHPIGAVAEQDDPVHEREASTGSDTTAQGDESIAMNYEDERPKKTFLTGHRMLRDRLRHPNSLLPGRHSYQRKYPKSEVEEPYPLLKPPPLNSMRSRGNQMKKEKQNRRRRVPKPRVFKMFKTEPLFEADHESDLEEEPVPTLLRPPPPVAESKSDNIMEEAEDTS